MGLSLIKKPTRCFFPFHLSSKSLGQDDFARTGCQAVPAGKDSGAFSHSSLANTSNDDLCIQEFRAELLAAESKDKKFTKRKTALKKIVANITMGNDSWCQFVLHLGLEVD